MSILIKNRRCVMKRLSITIVILFMVFTMACKKSSEISTREGPGTNSGTTQSAPAQSQSSEAAPVSEENPPVAAPFAAPEPTAAAGLNPPHGQPNHRCDIAVGVPLDSPPGTGKTPPVASGQNMPLPTAITSTPTAAAPTAPGMNPPHGQPNHRCDIAVGAPLDSPPGTGKTPPVSSQLNAPVQTTTTPTAPGMNPPHGQPNHRCDIPVGAPLDSPPATPK
ncbi:MAG: hypothetical protein A2W25_13300 [candidate division Zixibacteria bacterium RBG_16_53_22]|nr:MAG: hypothetical protein A2W25_13300 [candidate division Zixibacteria bacterium RBG_16_53_22]